jgi:hypothetical protein
LTDVMPAELRVEAAAVAAEHPGDASAPAGSAGADPGPPAAGEAGDVGDPVRAPGGGAVEAPPDVHAIPVPSVTAATAQAVAARRAAKPRPMVTLGLRTGAGGPRKGQ